MSYLTDHKQKFDDLRAALHEDNRTQLRRSANGGNTVIFVYPPDEEKEYIEKAKELYPDGHFIDIAELFVKSIDLMGNEYNDFDKTLKPIDGFKEFYKENISTTFKVFTNENENCLFSLIVKEICSLSREGKIVFLINTGALEGTGIGNVNIMEYPLVMAQNIPLVFCYPATLKNDKLFFLNNKPASSYRCKLVK